MCTTIKSLCFLDTRARSNKTEITHLQKIDSQFLIYTAKVLTVKSMQNDIVTQLPLLNRPESQISLALSTKPAETAPIHLPVIDPTSNPEILVFNLNDIKQLRNKYHILGILIGTLQQYPQQNIFLSVPLKLNIYEVLWLVQYQYAILIDQLAYRNAKLKNRRSNFRVR